MGTKLFVGGLPWATDEQGLSEAFAPFGTVVEARIILDRETGRSRGFGFVTMSSEAEAKAAIDGMAGQQIGGRSVTVREADDRGRRGGGDRRPRRAPPTPAPTYRRGGGAHVTSPGAPPRSRTGTGAPPRGSSRSYRPDPSQDPLGAGPSWPPEPPPEPNQWDDRRRRKGPKRKERNYDEVEGRRGRGGRGGRRRRNDFYDDDDW